MKTRIIAFLTAIMLLLTMFAFAGCKDEVKDDDKDKDNSEVSEAPKPATPKDVLLNAIQNVLGEKEEGELPEILANYYESDLIGTLSLSVNKLSIQGEDITGGKPIKLTIDAKSDYDNKLMSAEVALDFLGEKPAMDMFMDENGVYYYNIPGITEKPIKLDPKEITGSAIEAFDTNAFIEDLKEAVSDVIAEVLDDKAFVSETKDVVIDGTEYKGATVITLTIGKDAVEKVFDAITKAFTENKTLNELIEAGRLDLNFDAEGFKDIKVIGTIAEEALLGLDIEITTAASDDDEVQSGIVNMATDASEPTETFAIRCALKGSGYKVEMGILKADGEYDYDETVVELVYTLDDKTFDETFDINVIEGTETVTPVKYEGSFKDGKREGEITVDFEGTAIGLEFSTEVKANKFKLAVTEITMSSEGYPISIPLDLTFNYKTEDKKVTVDGGLDFAFMGMVNIDVTFDMTTEIADVKLEKITDSVSINEVDPEAIGVALMQKYPTLFSFIEGLTGSMGEDHPNNDENWGDEEWEDIFEDYYSVRGDDSKLYGTWVCVDEYGTMVIAFKDGYYTYYEEYLDENDEVITYEFTDKYYADDGILCLYYEGIIDYVCLYEFDGHELTLDYLEYDFTEVYTKHNEANL